MESEGPLLGHDSDSELALAAAGWWQQHKASRNHGRKSRSCVEISVVTALVTLSTFFILFLLWNSAFEIPETQAEPASSEPATPQRDLKFLLHPEDHVSREPRITRFSWNITKATIAPDGVEKEVLLINHQFPGPTIEARSGDTLEIEVLNQLEEGVSLHWHGLHMRGANHMDGPVGLTQCAIPAGKKFVYRVPVDNQVGTFWYHAHSQVQRGDGLYGGLVVHSAAETLETVTYQYDAELLLLVGDWYHWPSNRVLGKYMSISSLGQEPCPDSLLINGLGYFECSMAVPAAPVNCSEVERPWFLLDKKSRYRVRLVNVGSLTGISLTIPDAEVNVIQIDGGYPVISHPANSVGVLYPGERADFVMTWLESAVDTDTEMIFKLDKEYFLQPNFALTPTQSFLISAASTNRRPAENNTQEVVTFDLRNATGSALTTPLPDVEATFMIYSVVEILAHQNSIPKGFINRTTWEPQSLPLVSLAREEWDPHQLVPWTGSKPAWVELTINNIDTTGHPFHLHGFNFYVVASYEGKGGWDYYNPFTPEKPPRGGPFNLVNPLRKDTIYVPSYGYVVLRFLADNEGIWALHCHVLWHQGSGMVMAFQVLGDERGLSQSAVGLSARESCVAQ